MAGPRGTPVLGSIGVSEPSVDPSALFVTQSVLRSHEGTMCCGFEPTLNVLTTCIVAGSITDTLFEPWLGT